MDHCHSTEFFSMALSYQVSRLRRSKIMIDVLFGFVCVDSLHSRPTSFQLCRDCPGLNQY